MLISKREQPLMFVFTQKGFIPGVQIMDGLQSAAVYELILMRVHHVRYLRLVLWPGATLPCHHSGASCSPSHSYSQGYCRHGGDHCANDPGKEGEAQKS